MTEPQLAMIAMKTNDQGDLEVEMGVSHGELDMSTPHGYTLNWLGQNWDMLHKMAQVSFTAYKEQEQGHNLLQSIQPSLKLINAQGTGLVQH